MCDHTSMDEKRPRERRLTAKERARALAAIEEARRLQARLLAGRDGRPFESSAPLIREAREERLRQLLGRDEQASGGDDK
jgi:hypothetical protein